MFSGEYCEIFKNSFFYRISLVDASEIFRLFRYCLKAISRDKLYEGLKTIALCGAREIERYCWGKTSIGCGIYFNKWICSKLVCTENVAVSILVTANVKLHLHENICKICFLISLLPKGLVQIRCKKSLSGKFFAKQYSYLVLIHTSVTSKVQMQKWKKNLIEANEKQKLTQSKQKSKVLKTVFENIFFEFATLLII